MPQATQCNVLCQIGRVKGSQLPRQPLNHRSKHYRGLKFNYLFSFLSHLEVRTLSSFLIRTFRHLLYRSIDRSIGSSSRQFVSLFRQDAIAVCLSVCLSGWLAGWLIDAEQDKHNYGKKEHRGDGENIERCETLDCL